LARRGEVDGAVELARDAVGRAEPTDALVDRADAWAALGVVLELTGDRAGAASSREQAHALYEQKGATALADRLGGAVARRRQVEPVATNAAALAERSAPNAAVRWAGTWLGTHDWDGQRRQLHPTFVADDRRPGLRAIYDREQHLASLRTVASFGAT